MTAEFGCELLFLDSQLLRNWPCLQRSTAARLDRADLSTVNFMKFLALINCPPKSAGFYFWNISLFFLWNSLGNVNDSIVGNRKLTEGKRGRRDLSE